MTSSDEASGKQAVSFRFTPPFRYPGTPEAVEAGCRCSFERNMRAGFVSAERGSDAGAYLVIHDDCPIHEIIHKPMDDVI